MRLLMIIFISVFVYNTGLVAQTGESANEKDNLTIASCQFPVSSSIPENAKWIKEQMI